jgi:radical SAM protein with 4Fe4S-binding SPASM domain
MERVIMPDATFEKVKASLQTHRDDVKVIVLYHGGEPLLNKSFFRWIRDLKEINDQFFIKTVSNGMALTDAAIESLLDCGIDSIEFSLDGMSAIESQQVREKSNTQRIVGNVNRLIARKKAIQQEKPDVFIATTQFKGANDDAREVRIPAWLKEAFPDGVAGFKGAYAVQWPHMGRLTKYDVVRSDGADKNECDHVVNTITVRADGTVVPCCYDLTSKLPMGNINDDSLADIWNSRLYIELRRSIREKKYMSICGNCAVVRPPKYLIPKRVLIGVTVQKT